MKKHHHPLSATLLLAMFTFLAAHTPLIAQDAEGDQAANAADAKIPVFKPGDQIYFRITASDIKDSSGNKIEKPIFLIGNTKLSLNEELLLVNDPANTYSISVQLSKKESLPAGDIKMNAVMDDLQKAMKANPDNRKKWSVTMGEAGKSVTLTFAGIKRTYELKTILVPGNSSHRDNAQYTGTFRQAPMFRVYIDRNGKAECMKVDTSTAAWKIDLPSSKTNRLEVREGVGERYLIRLRDKNTTFYEHPIMEYEGISAEDFSQKVLKEKKPAIKDSAVELHFELLEDGIPGD